MIKLSEIKSNPNNPRLIKDDKFKKLVNSIKEFPKMMDLRPIIIDNDSMILGGNMRLKALLELKYSEVPNGWIKKAKDLTEDETRRFIIADNVGFGEHDWDLLANEWDSEQLIEWGVVGFPFDNLEEGEVDLKQHSDSADKYLNSTIRQILLVFDNDTHKVVVDKLKKIGEENNIFEDNSATVLKLIEHYENN